MSKYSVFLVGNDREQALDCMPFDNSKEAEQYMRDNGYTKVWEATVTLDPDSMELVVDTETGFNPHE